MNHIAFIPARGGSKGVPGKNMAFLNGKPLVYWTLKYAIESNIFTDIIFSSDCPIITAYASGILQKRVSLRPYTDHPDSQSAHSLLSLYTQQLTLHSSSWLWYLQPTSPLRSCIDTQNILALLSETSADTVVSLRHVPTEYSSQWQFKMDSLHNLSPIESKVPARRQELSPRYIRDGRFYVTKTSSLLNTQSLIGSSTAGLLNNDIPHVNIDEPKDLHYAKTCAEYLP